MRSFHSRDVLQRGVRLYNAELWVLFVDERFADWRRGTVVELKAQHEEWSGAWSIFST